jgi:hypothetical protein
LKNKSWVVIVLGNQIIEFIKPCFHIDVIPSTIPVRVNELRDFEFQFMVMAMCEVIRPTGGRTVCRGRLFTLAL